MYCLCETALGEREPVLGLGRPSGQRSQPSSVDRERGVAGELVLADTDAVVGPAQHDVIAVA